MDEMERYTKDGGYACALAIDDYLAGLVDDFSNNVGTLAVDNTDDDIRRAVQYLDDALAPQSERHLVLSPAAANNLRAIDRYVHADFGGAGVVGKGSVPTTIYGLQTSISTNVEGSNTIGHDNGAFHKNAAAVAIRKSPHFKSVWDTDYLGEKASMSVIFGALETRDDHGVWLKGK